MMFGFDVIAKNNKPYMGHLAKIIPTAHHLRYAIKKPAGWLHVDTIVFIKN